jgi:UDP-N-acetylglucosamine--N-acetylmuramyl-(pentapeptide) pyrophosphoryl-undecaprenol N-acetylglucosamine transferase
LGGIILAAGGTGGHLYPALALAARLEERGHPVHFVTSARGLGADLVRRQGYPVTTVRARGLSGGLPGLLKALLETGLGLLQSLVLLARRRPALVVGTGGYGSAPVVAAAALLGIPTMILEQNAFPGKTTFFLARLARKVCLSFPESASLLPGARTEVTGNPIRPEILSRSRQEARQSLGIPEDRFCLLVSGASQGAASLNEAVLSSLPAWEKYPWTILHLTGPSHYGEVRVRVEGLARGALDYRPVAYMDDMASAYAAADLVVSRAGATTLAEITARGLPAVLVPYPHAAEAHQDKNAQALARAGGAVVLADSEVRTRLAATVAELAFDAGRRADMARASGSLGQPRALERVVEIALTLATTSARAGDLAAAPGRGGSRGSWKEQR